MDRAESELTTGIGIGLTGLFFFGLASIISLLHSIKEHLKAMWKFGRR